MYVCVIVMMIKSQLFPSNTSTLRTIRACFWGITTDSRGNGYSHLYIAYWFVRCILQPWNWCFETGFDEQGVWPSDYETKQESLANSIPWIILLSIVLKVGRKKTRFKNFKGVNRGWCRCHFWTRDHTVSVIPGLKRKWVLSSGRNSSLKKKIYFAFLLEIKIVESGSRVERQRTQGIWLLVRWLSGCHESCWWKQRSVHCVLVSQQSCLPDFQETLRFCWQAL